MIYFDDIFNISQKCSASALFHIEVKHKKSLFFSLKPRRWEVSSLRLTKRERKAASCWRGLIREVGSAGWASLVSLIKGLSQRRWTDTTKKLTWQHPGDTVQKLLDLHKVRCLIIWTSDSCINSAFNIQRNTNKICVSLKVQVGSSSLKKNVSSTILKLRKHTEKEKLESFTVFITLFRELVKCKDKSCLCKIRCSI